MKFFLFFILCFANFAQAHEGHHHVVHSQEEKEATAPPDTKKIYDEIQAHYLSDVKPIFDKKCADCHSATIPPPWYGQIPGVHWLIERDRTKGQKHLEISKGFPFAGHGTVDEDFTDLEKEINKNDMPPMQYWIVHPSSRLTETEKHVILDWIRQSQNLILNSHAH